MAEVNLSPEDLEALNQGESVALTDDYSIVGKVTVHPPCEESGHEWTGHDIRQMDGEVRLIRRCQKCSHTDERVIESADSLFDQVEFEGDF